MSVAEISIQGNYLTILNALARWAHLSQGGGGDIMQLVGDSYESIPVADEQAQEAELIRRCVSGEKGAFDAFYRAHCRFVAVNLLRVLGSDDDLEDLVQEVFVIAYRGLPRFRGEARLRTWLYRICVNVGLGAIRRRRRRLNVVPMTESQPQHPLAPDSPVRDLERRQDQARVHRLLEQLPPKKRVVLLLHEIEGKSLKEIAYLVGTNPITVRTRLFYARKEFYRLVAEEAHD